MKINNFLKRHETQKEFNTATSFVPCVFISKHVLSIRKVANDKRVF